MYVCNKSCEFSERDLRVEMSVNISATGGTM